MLHFYTSYLRKVLEMFSFSLQMCVMSYRHINCVLEFYKIRNLAGSNT